ncbi:MAG: protein translocase subunit SecD [Acidimicrobiales bacterium]|nr:protein translocase subunit SecD [Acidimicrobiales bacterium]
MRGQLSLAIGIVFVAIAGIVYTFAAGNEPLLGLDLQGGVSVVLEPEPNPDGSEVSEDILDQAIAVIRNRVDGLGVREPEITRQGLTVLVQIPGVDDQQRALDLVGQTAELRFRPVLMRGGPGTDFTPGAALCPGDGDEPPDFSDGEPTPEASAAECMVADGTDGIRYLLGPAPELIENEGTTDRLTGLAVEDASARFAGQWQVSLVMRGGSPGIDDFNELASQCFAVTITCPTASIAIEIDGVVESAPSVNAPTFDRSQISITGSFSEGEAKDLALVLRFGSLPVELTPQESRTVSSTLGEDALDAGIAAGVIGLALVSIYLLAYYRLLGLVAIASLGVSGALLWTMIAWLGESQGLALTLAGVTGLIVSVGVSVDSNVVYFEHLKEDVRGGRTVRSAVERAFPIAYSTIVKADVASLIAAVVLYFLTVGQVKGFALFLGLATVLDLVATYFFMGPVIRLMARRDAMTERPRRYGIPAGEVSA